MTDIETDIFLNQVAQGVKPVKDAAVWFGGLADDTKLAVLRRVAYFAGQAGAVGNDAESAIAVSGLKRTYTVCQLSLKAMKDRPMGSITRAESLTTALNLPAYEREKTFRLFMALFAVADARRRAKGLEPERHWWHRDLSDERVVAEIVSASRSA